MRTDRRRFIQTTGVLAVGSVLGSSLAGCSAELLGTPLPSLGPAPPPTPVPGMTYIWASKIGCALDCDLSTGRNMHTGGEATDDAPRINEAMAGASAANPITLIIDGSALISGLFLPAGGYWSIAGLGSATGFYTKSGSNCGAIQNAGAVFPWNPGPPAPPRNGSNVSLSNFTLNGNQNGVSTTGTRQGSHLIWYCGIALMNLKNISIENLVLANVPAYHVFLSNVGNVTVSGCIMQSAGLNTDGVHFNGPANDISISNCQFATGDDSIALNAPEGYSGDIERVTVIGCTFNSLSLMRLYTVSGPSGPTRSVIDGVTVSNCNGTLWNGAFVIGLSNGSLPNSIASLTISDCNFTAPTVLALAEDFGKIVLENVKFTPSQARVVWPSQESNHVSAFLRPSLENPGVTSIGSSLSFQNCSIVRKQNMNVAAVILQVGSEIGNVEFDGFAVQDGYSPINGLIELEGSTIGQLSIDSLNSSNIEAPIQPGGFAYISSVTGTGTGVLATGWEFPDAVMANEVPYVSATTGQPSIKVNGVVEPYNPS